MAELGYNEGIASVQPSVDAPNDYQNIQPKVGAAVQGLGAAASKAGQFFGTVAADNAFNDFEDGVTKILHGDPSKSTPGPDGAPMPDTGYLGLKGRQALDARPNVEQQIDGLLTTIQGNLQSPEQIQQFENYSRRYRANAQQQIGTHADTQATTWYTQVNSNTATNAKNRIAANPLDPNELASGLADLTNAYTKNAEMMGAVKGDEVWSAAQNQARQDGLTAQLMSIGVNDPARALSILEKNRAVAGLQYDNLAGDFRARAATQEGQQFAVARLTEHTATAAATNAASYVNPALPIYQQVVTDMPGGMSADGVAKTVKVESNGDPNARNASGHIGLSQASDATWKAYGNGGDPTNPEDAIAFIQRYAVANSKYLTPILGRRPTDAELYIAHQQGPAGAAHLFANPSALASSIVGSDAVLKNGGTAGMTAADFVAMWVHKFSGTSASGIVTPEGPRSSISVVPGTPTQPQANVPADAVAAQTVDAGPAAPQSAPAAPSQPSVKASVYQDILDSDMSPQAKSAAMAYANQQLAAQQVANDATASQKKQANDDAMKKFGDLILSGNTGPDLQQAILNSPDLSFEGQRTLIDLQLAHADQSLNGTAAAAAYGPGYAKRLAQIVATPGDPSRMTDPLTLFQAASGPNADLTLAGASRLATVMSSVGRSVNDQAAASAKSSLLDYAKTKLSFDGTLLVPGVPTSAAKDPQGALIYSARFVPKFEAAYDDWIKAGKNPWDFLTQENVDKLSAGLRSPKEMAMARMVAQETGIDPTQLAAPPAPAGVDSDAWKLVVNAPPMIPTTGKPVSQDNWIGAIAQLRADSSPKRQAQFDQTFGPMGAPSAKDLLDMLGERTDTAGPVGQPADTVPQQAAVVKPRLSPGEALSAHLGDVLAGRPSQWPTP